MPWDREKAARFVHVWETLFRRSRPVWTRPTPTMVG
jgi:hypothetical protein